ncbi:hypothetical protein AUR64_17270 [Haloprofundus marisrubri]|uniref:Integrase n=1 Tax=Haloprofundus marisrubri TaxID=1514971 RepID=A0A0W1R8I8_9EURY|nr:hypothetical protein AUR64_17270 [Haloprofundus marisrubri]
MEVLVEYLGQVEAWQSIHTLRNRKVVTRQFCEWLDGRKTLFEVDKRTVKRWMTYLLNDGYAPRSVRQKTYALSAMYRELEDWNEVPENPIEQIDEIEKLSQTRLDEHTDRQYLTIEEYETLVDACDTLRDTLVIQLLWNTGVRVQEAVSITEDAIDRENRSIEVETIKGNKFESSKTRTVYYKRSFGRTLRRWLDEGGRNRYLGANNGDDEGHLLVTREAPTMFVNRVTEIVRKVADEAGIQTELYVDQSGRPRNRIVGHLFRKSYGVHRTKNGMPIAYLTELMGHSDMEITREHYLKFREDDIQEAERTYAPGV